MSRSTRRHRHSALAAALFLPLLSGCAAAAGDMGSNLAMAAGIPQMDAFLPSRESVPAGAALAIDGDYTVSTIGKTIRLEGGRAYAVDPWLHALTLKVRPGMIVMQDIVQTGPSTYTANDLPLMGNAALTVTSPGQIDVVVQGSLGPARYALIRENGPVAPLPVTDPIADPDHLPPVDDTPGTDCNEWGFDETAGGIVCLDPAS